MAKVSFTAGRIKDFVQGVKASPDKKQAFLWDSTVPGLGVRITPNGEPAYVFQAAYQGRDLRVKIGSPNSWSIPQAQTKARELKRLIDEGRDPRIVVAEKTASDVAVRKASKQAGLTFGEAWVTYLAERKPLWSELHYRDHVKLSHLGGEPRTRRGSTKTVPGSLAYFLPLRLNAIDGDIVQAWAAKESATRPARARLALRVLKAFLRWCGNERGLAPIVDANAASGKKTREAVGSAKPKNDYLQREQLAVWFEHVRQIQNPVIAAYLQCLLLTGARREELAALKWEDVNFQWRGVSMRDKVEGTRPVPLTSYVSFLIQSLPKRNEWVFSSPSSSSGRLMEPAIAHRQACAAAGLELSLHGLRRSFASLCEWLDIPGGVSAQIQGHAPQGVREQNYIRRPLDLLRVHHGKIEAWILEQAGVAYVAGTEVGKLRAVV